VNDTGSVVALACMHVFERQCSSRRGRQMLTTRRTSVLPQVAGLSPRTNAHGAHLEGGGGGGDGNVGGGREGGGGKDRDWSGGGTD
jgi:hypothetical protein